MKKIPKAKFDGGSLDCGSGLLLLIRKHIDPLAPGDVLEFTSTEVSVEEDLPAWCNLTGNKFLSLEKSGATRIFCIEKAGDQDPKFESENSLVSSVEKTPKSQIEVLPFIPIASGSVLGIGSFPRPPWMLRAIHEQLASRIGEDEFENTVRDAVQLALQAQIRAGVHVLSDGEQSRENYASFLGQGFENCQLIPLVDVLPYVDDPEEFRSELAALDIPATDVRHPMVFGPLKRKRFMALEEAKRLHSLCQSMLERGEPKAATLPLKVALPGPYLLTRMMWMDCVVDRAYPTREALAADLVGLLREEVQELLKLGVSLVQLDEPIWTEVVFGAPKKRRSFMCGILGERGDAKQELGFATELFKAVTQNLPRERLGMHLCRGNWTADEAHALRGDYSLLTAALNSLPVGTLFLEMATERAGEMGVLSGLNADFRLGLGVANQKRVEDLETVQRRVRAAKALFGPDRLLYTPDCGFATFAENPIQSAQVAEKILSTIVQAVHQS